jgi:ectoine hydroxylase-related dioxygenase (phytanoyl-CoA dioxygenase family)
VIDRLNRDGFVVIDGPFAESRLRGLSQAYDRAMHDAVPPDISVAATTTRAHGFVRRGAEFDDVHLFPPILEACQRTIGESFALSAFLGRTLLSGAAAQRLHIDCARNDPAYPMIGFIVMIDDFDDQNGATLFVPGSHRWDEPKSVDGVVAACGSAGSIIVYSGSVLHGHGANRTRRPRRSLQGAYVRS